jgi:hypothetical protein
LLLTECAQLLPKLHAGGHKVLIFSQMIRLLDVLETYLTQKRYTCALGRRLVCLVDFLCDADTSGSMAVCAARCDRAPLIGARDRRAIASRWITRTCAVTASLIQIDSCFCCARELVRARAHA